MHYVKLADLARQYLFEAGEQTDHKFARANYHATQVAKQLNQHLLRRPQPARLTVRANKTCVLPADLVDLQRVALVRGSEVINLTAAPLLTLDRVGGAAGNPGTTQVLGQVQPINPNLNYQDFTTHLGVGGGYNAAGHYRLDLAGGQLILGPDVPADAQVYIEYLASGLSADGTDQVPITAEFAIIAYLDWKMVDKLRGVGSGEKQRLQEEYKRQVRLLQRLQNLTTPKELLEALSKHYSKTVR